MRGEKSETSNENEFVIGSPPHARGKGVMCFNKLIVIRITPACAGKSMTVGAGGKVLWDHPRMRGEKM